MSSRFEMAEALALRARERFKEMAPYQHESFQIGIATMDLKIAIKEILDHLRAALDYSARELHARFGNANTKARVYFPVARPTETETYFKTKRVQKDIPGLPSARPDLVETLASFQFFAATQNAWLPCFAELSSENKHEQLSLQRAVPVKVEIEPEHEGRPVYAIHRSDGTSFGKGFMVGLCGSDRGGPAGGRRGGPSGGGGSGWRNSLATDRQVMCDGLYFRFDAINYEVNSCLEIAMDGVDRVIRELRSRA